MRGAESYMYMIYIQITFRPKLEFGLPKERRKRKESP